MFSSNMVETLPSEVQDFIKKHHIQVINPWGRFDGGADFVFSFMFKGATADVLACAYQNVKGDKRFNAEQRVELQNIMTALLENGTYKRFRTAVVAEEKSNTARP